MPKHLLPVYFSFLCLVFSTTQIQAFQNIEELSQKVEYYQQEEKEDSATYYYTQLQQQLTTAQEPLRLFLAQNTWLLYQWHQKQLDELDIQEHLIGQQELVNELNIQNQATVQAWLAAYDLLEHIISEQVDSAMIQLELIKKEYTTQTTVLAWAHSWLIDYWITEQGTYAAIHQLLEEQQTYLATNNEGFIPIFEQRALAYQWIQLPNQAIVNYQQTLELLTDKILIPQFAISQIHYAIAEICYQLYNVQRAKKHLELALINLPTTHPKSGLLKAHVHILWVKLSNDFNNVEQRITTIKNGIANLVNIELIEEAKARYQLQLLGANYYLQKKQLDSVQYYLTLAKETAEQHPTIPTATFPIIESELLLLQQQPIMALDLLKKNLLEDESWANEQQARLWANLAKAQYAASNYKAALKSIQNSIWLFSSEEPNTSKSYPSLVSLYTPEDLLEVLLLKTTIGLQLYEQSQYNYSLKSIYETTRYNLKLLRNLQQELPQEHKLEDFTQNATLVLEQALEAAWLMYERYQKKQYLEETLEAAELNRTIQLRRALHLNQATDIPLESLEKERFLQYQINLLKQQWSASPTNQKWIQNQLDYYQKEWENLYQNLQKNYPKYFDAKYGSPIVAIDSIQHYLPDSTAMVTYMEGKKAIYQLILTTDTFLVKKIVWRTYHNTLDLYHSYLHDSSSTSTEQIQRFDRLSYELYHKILHDPLVADATRLIFIADGRLQYLPFETLITRLATAQRPSSYGQLMYLIHKSRISYHYSPSLWLQQRQHPNQTAKYDILGMATSYQEEVIPSWRSPKLHHWRQSIPPQTASAELLSRLQDKYEGDYYTEQSATEYYLKRYAPRYGVLHLGFNNIMDELVLAEDGSEQEDNFLSIHDIKQLALTSDLVLLTNTNAQTPTTKNLVALGRSFIYAGSPSLVISLWQPKEASQQVLINFYEKLKKGLAKDKALQLAKLDYLALDSAAIQHPSFWANYIQIGTTASISIREPVIHIWWFVIPIAIIGGLGWWSMQALRQKK